LGGADGLIYGYNLEMALYVKNVQENNGILTIGLHNTFHRDTDLDGDFNNMYYKLNLNGPVSYNEIDDKHIYKFSNVTITLSRKEYRRDFGAGLSNFAKIQENNPISQLDASLILDTEGIYINYPRLKQILDNAYTKHVKQVGRELIGTKGLVNSGKLNRNASSRVGSFLSGVNKKSLKNQINMQKEKLARKTRKTRKN
jgi:hypothetical protein